MRNRKREFEYSITQRKCVDPSRFLISQTFMANLSHIDLVDDMPERQYSEFKSTSVIQSSTRQTTPARAALLVLILNRTDEPRI